jgi:hypothetical protein
MYEQPKTIGELLKISRGKDGRNTSQNKKSNATEPGAGANSERAHLIGKFTDTLNSKRDGKRYRKLTYAAVAVKLSHLSLQDLYYFWRYCEDAKNFSSCFWWSLKVEKK